MNKTYLLSLFIILSALKLEAQSIVAGIAGWDDYYYDFVPDWNFPGPGSNQFYNDSLLLDVNNDGIDDFKWIVHDTNWYQWGHLLNYALEPLNQNSVAYSYTDTCTSPTDSVWYRVYPMAKHYGYGEDVLINENWQNSSLYLNYADWNFMIPSQQHMCSAPNPADTIDHYIGIKVLTSTDTLYGWIGFNPSLQIMNYACNLFTVGLSELEISEKQVLKVYDLLGRETEDVPNTVLMYLYSDGTIEKKYIVE